jgi:exodeoxyribonuclease V alpha subunit
MEVPKGPEGKDDLEWIKAKLPPVIQRIVAKHAVDPIRDIQILTPMRIGPAGSIEFNKVLQETLNPNGKEVTVKGHKFRTGDRVMQLANNYQQGMEISNGDIGFIKEFDETHKEILIDFYGRLVRYPFKETDNLSLSYAATTHKSQGSEFEIVILLMTMHHYPMLERNLLYTANTRARKMIVFLASWAAVKRAVEQCNVNCRNTFLVQRIRKEVKAVELPAAA